MEKIIGGKGQTVTTVVGRRQRNESAKNDARHGLEEGEEGEEEEGEDDADGGGNGSSVDVNEVWDQEEKVV